MRRQIMSTMYNNTSYYNMLYTPFRRCCDKRHQLEAWGDEMYVYETKHQSLQLFSLLCLWIEFSSKSVCSMNSQAKI